MIKRILITGWIGSSILLLLYSFTQVDLNLTFSRISFLLSIGKPLQEIGYFQRPLSTFLYAALVGLLFILYFATLHYIKKGLVGRRMLWGIVLMISAILLFSYNAFSYDLFNYIFDARIVTHYQSNPYEHKPQDFMNDPMLAFMRSVHRTYPYGPVWLVLTVPFTFMGSEIFILTFYVFKALMVASYVGTAFFLEKILTQLKSRHILMGVSFFALNPLVIIESLVSAHNDVVMVFFAVFAFYMLLKKNYLLSFVLLTLSIGIKFVTVFLVPIFILLPFLQAKKINIDTGKILLLALLLMVVSVIAMSKAGGPKTPEPQPWYLLNVIPFAALFAHKKVVQSIAVAVSIGILLFYVPFLYTGEWPGNIIDIKLWILLVSIVIGGVIYLFSSIRKNSSIKRILDFD